ncbi:Inherit from COG: Methyltransferase [Seminavis robusta]|uniref:Inherit from COG: Methyltransferase n=1 Tax=Seminavis robusta TaxID=568900 RepID=A0A9N8E148_9STRA|nr:Inherit from COG: Methyltransferase [Seminavis robusta]|eukprot:Sro455_g146520.1 Inherit from COG: Methyltransferase (416) ;mRNA; r:29709-30956
MKITRQQLSRRPWYREHAIQVSVACVFLSVLVVFLLVSAGIIDDETNPRPLLQVQAVQQQANSNFPSQYPPLSCQEWLRDIPHYRLPLRDYVPEFQDPNHGKQFTRVTDGYPFFTIALHNEQFDPARWSIVKWGHYYETALTAAFSAVLNETVSSEPVGTTVRVLDVGANIGYFSLLSAGHHGNIVVDAFEPNRVNAFRICQSLQINHWLPNEYEIRRQSRQLSQQSTVNCHPYGIGKDVGKMVFHEVYNPGAGNFVAQPNDHTLSNSTLPVITLDAFAESRGWFISSSNTNRPVIALFKVDVEGYELHVVQGATRLLSSHLIRNIFMEVSARTRSEIHDSRAAVQLIAEAGYDVYQYGGFRGPKHVVNWSSRDPKNLTDLVIQEVTKKRHPQLNLWWKLAPKNAKATTQISKKQ